MNNGIVPIVEGQSEVESVPLLLRRLLAEQLNASSVRILRPFRVKRTKVVREGELERAVTLTARVRQSVGGILVILDADDDCPAQLGPRLLSRAAGVTSLPVAVVLANRELEAWFLGAKESLRGVRGIRADAQSPAAPESIRGAKERLSQNMTDSRYIGVDDQPALAAKMDLASARQRCPSFDKLVRDLSGLVASIGNSNHGTGPATQLERRTLNGEEA